MRASVRDRGAEQAPEDIGATGDKQVSYAHGVLKAFARAL
jgi:hypothetical protein